MKTKLEINDPKKFSKITCFKLDRTAKIIAGILVKGKNLYQNIPKIPTFFNISVIFGYCSIFATNFERDALTIKKKTISNRKLINVAKKTAAKNIPKFSQELPAEIDSKAFSIIAPVAAKIKYFLELNHEKIAV